MPQRKRGLTEEELREAGMEPLPTTLPSSPTVTVKKPSITDRLAAGVLGASTGALGGLKAGPGAMAVGGVVGGLGGAIDPETVEEQSAANLAVGPLGPIMNPAVRAGASRALRFATSPLARAGAAGAAAGGVNLAKTGDPSSAALTGALETGGGLLGEFVGMFAPGGLKAGAQKKTQEILSRFREGFGGRPVADDVVEVRDEILSVFAPAERPRGATAAQEKAFARTATKPEVDPLFKVASRYGEAGRGVQQLPADIMGNHELSKRFFASDKLSEKAKTVVLGRYLDDAVISPYLISVKTGRGVMEEEGKEIFDAGKALSALKKIERQVEGLPKGVNDKLEQFRDLLRYLDPSEAVDVQQKAAGNLLKVGVFSSMREAAGMRGAIAGGAAGTLANLHARIFNPEVRQLVRMGAPRFTFGAGATGRTAAPILSNFLSGSPE